MSNEPSCIASKNPKAVCLNSLFSCYSLWKWISDCGRCVFANNIFVWDKIKLLCFWCIAARVCFQGAVFSISFSEDCPFTLGIGGSKGKLEVGENHVLWRLYFSTIIYTHFNFSPTVPFLKSSLNFTKFNFLVLLPVVRGKISSNSWGGIYQKIAMSAITGKKTKK